MICRSMKKISQYKIHKLFDSPTLSGADGCKAIQTCLTSPETRENNSG